MTPVIVDWSPVLITSQNLNYLFKGPISEHSYTGGLGFPLTKEGGDTSVYDTQNQDFSTVTLLTMVGHWTLSEILPAQCSGFLPTSGLWHHNLQKASNTT